MAGLENGQVLHVKELVEERLRDCPVGRANAKEIEHLTKAVESMESVDAKIFDKIETLQKEANKKSEDIMKMLLAQFMTIGAGIIIGVAVYFFTRG